MQINFKTLGLLAFWLAAAGALFYFFNAKLHPNTAERLSAGPEVTLARDMSGHYRAEAFINGVKTTVMVDTGATDVAISARFAEQLGLQSNQAIRTQTANGATVAYMTRLQSIKLGGIVANNVAASIVPNLGTDMLLGMSFLNRMDVRLYKGSMTIRAVSE
ncbi:MAG: retroviral-like aspartic protease family protein [Nitrosomonadales bacterium]|nr:retroviral-like aspartic protease family protein [Nitrosomonadales bacterium]